ncbi:MAG: class I SAM-dependent methyltransferase [Luteolibacter sp.]
MLIFANRQSAHLLITLAMRKLTPELLDHLPPDAPGVSRSRRDLQRINFVMGNDRWIIRNLPKKLTAITEVGAGEGHLLTSISQKHPAIPITAIDLAPRPASLPKSINWIQADIFTQDPPDKGGVLIANLFLHHFTDSQLSELSKWISGFDTIITSEPFRAKIPLLLGKLATPLIHPITRHDMRVSIEAGFRPGELPSTLSLKSLGYSIRENSSQRGFIRMIAEK